MSADPLSVACPYCGRSAGYPCQQFDRLIGSWWGERKPHAARVRAAEKAGKERAKCSLPLVLLDGLECLDPETFNSFVTAAGSLDAQFICTRVTEGPLSVRVAA